MDTELFTINPSHITRSAMRDRLTPADNDHRAFDLQQNSIFGLDSSNTPIGAQPVRDALLTTLRRSMGLTEEQSETKRKGDLMKARSNLITLSSFPNRVAYLQEFLGVDQDDVVTPARFSSENLSDDVLAELIDAHVTRTRRVMTELNTQIPSFFERFDRFIKREEQLVYDESAMLFNIEPLSISAFNEIFPVIRTKYSQERERFYVAFADALTVVPIPGGDIAGEYDPSKNAILLFAIPRRSEGAPSRTFTHEVFHGLSGVTSLGHFVEDDGEDFMGDIDIQRLGLQFDHPHGLYRDTSHTPKEKLPRFTWLNEAVTEELTALSYDCMPNTYREERKILHDLAMAMEPYSGKKNPFLLFYSAYFEDYDPSQPPGKRVPHWRELQRVINDTFGSGFLVELDKHIRKHGVARGREFIKLHTQTSSPGEPKVDILK